MTAETDAHDEREQEVGRPIGWWLRRVDQLIERSFDRLLAAEGIGRRHWQTLNAIAGGAASRAELAEVLAPFAGSGPDLAVVLDLLRAKGWISEDAEAVGLTADGSVARGRLVVAVREHRTRVTDGIGEQEYRTTITTLQRMARNLS